MAQFMPGTWDEMRRVLEWDAGASRVDARLAIAAGAYYQAKLRRGWGLAGRSGLARNDLGAASYNAGVGNILAAQRRCGGARLWAQIAPCLDGVTGQAAETITYVGNIRRWWGMMEGE